MQPSQTGFFGLQARLLSRDTSAPSVGQVRNTAPPAVDAEGGRSSKISINDVPQQAVEFAPSMGGSADVDAKHYQAWLYPKGRIVRLPSVNVNGRLYTDPKGGVYTQYKEGEEIQPEWDLSGLEPRRKHESNFMVTINPNKVYRAEKANRARHLFYEAMTHVCETNTFVKCLKFGPKSAHYANDKAYDVVETGIKPSGQVEVGLEKQRMHCHLVFNTRHYSQIQLDPRMITAEFMKRWNQVCLKEGGHYLELMLVKKPYVQVKLLPQSDAVNIMRRYAEKSMMTFDY